MLRPFTLLAACALMRSALLPLVQADEFAFRTDYLPVGHVRTDPILRQDCLSDHVHSFYGPQLLRPEVTDAELRASKPSENSGNVDENKSLYWHPSIYEVIDGQYHLVESGDTTAYYIWEEGKAEAFPNGFRMIGGLPEQGENYQIAGCDGPSECEKSGDNCNSPDESFFPEYQCSELEVEMSFPNCWNGDLTSDNGIDHVRYSSDGTAGGDCPSSHPRRLPLITLFFRIYNYKGGHHTFSDGSSRFHADYISGWEKSKLQQVLDGCKENTFDTDSQDACRGFLTYRTTSLAELGSKHDDPFEAQNAELAALQPTPKLDTQATIAPEAITGIDQLPRKTCTGFLIPPSGGGGGDTTPNPPVQDDPSPDDPSPTCEMGCVDDFDACVAEILPYCEDQRNDCDEECEDDDCHGDCEDDFVECEDDYHAHCEDERDICFDDCEDP